MCSVRSEVRKWSPLEEHSLCLFSLSSASLQWWRCCSLHKQMVLSYSFQWKSSVKYNMDITWISMVQLWPFTSCLVHSTHRKASIPFCALSLPRDCHPYCFFKPHYYLNLPPLAVFTRALVTHFLLWIVFPWPIRSGQCCSECWSLLWFAHCLLVYTDPYSVCFTFVEFTPSVPHVKWHPLSLLQIPCRVIASSLVFQSVCRWLFCHKCRISYQSLLYFILPFQTLPQAVSIFFSSNPSLQYCCLSQLGVTYESLLLSHNLPHAWIQKLELYLGKILILCQ